MERVTRAQQQDLEAQMAKLLGLFEVQQQRQEELAEEQRQRQGRQDELAEEQRQR